MSFFYLNETNNIQYQETPWDARVLNFKTNEILKIHGDDNNLASLICSFESHCIANNILFTNVRINPVSFLLRRHLEINGYRNVETSLEFKLYRKSYKTLTNLSRPNIALRVAKSTDQDHLSEMAGTLFNHGRFFEDPLIPSHYAQKRNYLWMDDLLIRSTVLVGEVNSDIIAFMAISENTSKIQLLLGAVRPDYAILSYDFWQKIIEYCFDYYTNARQISAVVSATNIKAQNLYNHFGFKTTDVLLGYHNLRIKHPLNSQTLEIDIEQKYNLSS